MPLSALSVFYGKFARAALRPFTEKMTRKSTDAERVGLQMAALNLFLASAKTSTPMSVHRSDGRVDAREYSMVSHVLGGKKIKVFFTN